MAEKCKINIVTTKKLERIIVESIDRNVVFILFSIKHYAIRHHKILITDKIRKYNKNSANIDRELFLYCSKEPDIKSHLSRLNVQGYVF